MTVYQCDKCKKSLKFYQEFRLSIAPLWILEKRYGIVNQDDFEHDLISLKVDICLECFNEIKNLIKTPLVICA